VDETIPLLNRNQPDSEFNRKQTFKQLFEWCSSVVAVWCHPRLVATLLMLYCGMFSYYNIFFVLPPMGQELGLSKISVSLILAITSVVEIMGRVFAGGLVDRYKMPKDKFLVMTYIICAALGITTSFLLSENALFVFGLLFGSVGGTCVMWCVPMIMDLVEDSQQGAATGMFPLLAGLATGIGPIVIGKN
jgi:MFS family permease